MVQINIPLDRLPNVDKERILKYIHKVSWIVTWIYYMIDHRTRKQVNLLKWYRENNELPGDIMVKTEYICRLPTHYDKIRAILKFVRDNITYKPDSTVWKVDEKWQTPAETWELKTGDCVSNYETIYTDSGIKRVGELSVGDQVLSYDFRLGTYCNKKIIKIWEKGNLPLKRVHFRNGQHIDITDNHPLWVRSNQQGKSEYIKQYLKDIDLTKWYKRKVPIAKNIPYEIKDISWISEDLCFVIGHYLAEGWCSKGKVGSSGYDLIEQIIPILEKNNIPFREGRNGDNVPMINFLKSPLKEYLKILKKNSFDIHLPEELFHLPMPKLQKLLDGIYLGDGHWGNYPDKRGFLSNKAECYTTSCENFARDIQRIGLQLGKSYHIWKQNNHQGAGTKPIYRITFNSNSHFLRDHGYPDISEVSISYIEDKGTTAMRDFEVEDTHTFVFMNGIISHQCEDGALLIKALGTVYCIPEEQLYLVAGEVAGGIGHAYCVYVSERDALEYPIDWCYHYAKSIDMKILYINRFEYFGGEQEWFRFNQEGCYKLWKS